MSCERCHLIDRRAFLEAALAAVGVSALAACAVADPTAPAITSFTVTLADYPALATVGGIAVVDNGSRSGEPIAVARTAASTYVALSLVCPHRGTTVSVVNNNTSFYCTGHGARFAANGTWTGGQATSNLATYALTADQAAGTLQIG
jgi:Rieske Fe-S protein